MAFNLDFWVSILFILVVLGFYWFFWKKMKENENGGRRWSLEPMVMVEMGEGGRKMRIEIKLWLITYSCFKLLLTLPEVRWKWTTIHGRMSTKNDWPMWKRSNSSRVKLAWETKSFWTYSSNPRRDTTRWIKMVRYMCKSKMRKIKLCDTRHD